MTPFLLAEITRTTQGRSLRANIALVKNNAKVAAEIAVAYATGWGTSKTELAGMV